MFIWHFEITCCLSPVCLHQCRGLCDVYFARSCLERCEFACVFEIDVRVCVCVCVCVMLPVVSLCFHMRLNNFGIEKSQRLKTCYP